MDASALLKSQGWRGKGFSLHPTDNGIGLAKPLMLSRNTDGRGVGQQPHHTSDQWWLRAFDEKLKGLDTSKKGVTQSVTQGKLDIVANCAGNGKYSGAAGLYASFVRGETMVGSMILDTTTEESTDATPASDDREGRHRGGETKEERRARREARRIKKANKAARKAAEVEAQRRAAAKTAKRQAKLVRRASETKEGRRARKAERRAKKEARRKRRREQSNSTNTTDEG